VLARPMAEVRLRQADYMSPHPTFAARDQARDSAARKAAAYQANQSLRVFVESDVKKGFPLPSMRSNERTD